MGKVVKMLPLEGSCFSLGRVDELYTLWAYVLSMLLFFKEGRLITVAFRESFSSQ